MRIRKIPKGGGRYRTIYVPSLKEKERLRKLLPTLHEIHRQAVEQHGTRGVAHAFVVNRNPVTCALPHRGFQVTVSCDLENWFDTVTDQHLIDAGVPREIADAVTIPDEHGVRRCRQGLPTSPVAANIAAVVMDARILKALQTLCDGKRFAYTRYADDVTVSCDDPLLVPMILYALRWETQRMTWTLAEHKTHIQHAKSGRRIIVGIAVDDRVQATRKTRRKLRAARHQSRVTTGSGRITGATPNPTGGVTITVSVDPPNLNSPSGRAAASAAGLSEWAACKLPRKVRSVRQLGGVLANSGGGPSNATTDSSATDSQTTNRPALVLGTARRIWIG